jgi:hypothetical protein
MSEAFRLDGKAAARRVKRSRPHNGPVVTRQVPGEAWATALRLAGGNPRRLQILSPDAVLVLNKPRKP